MLLYLCDPNDKSLQSRKMYLDIICRIYSIYRLGRLLNFGPWGWALIRGERLFEAGRLLNFHKVVSIFCDKTINRNKLRRCTKAEFKHDFAIDNSSILIDRHTMNLEIISQWRNNDQHSSWSSCELRLFLFGRRGEGLGWALIRGWAINRINTVFKKLLLLISENLRFLLVDIHE